MTSEFDFYLASQSPRRRELLTQIGALHETLSIDIDETPKENENGESYVIRLAGEKARAGWFSESHVVDKPVLGADTAVVINGRILGKPESHEHAINMLTLLSAQTHQVMSAVALATKRENSPGSQYSAEPELYSIINVSDVTFRKLSKPEIEHYLQSEEGVDKAGAYAIQGMAAAFITHLSGSYSGVMGLPLYETVELMRQAGVSTESLHVSQV